MMNDDVGGAPLWTIPKSDEMIREAVCDAIDNQIIELESFEYSGMARHINLKFIRQPIPEGASEEFVRGKVAEGIAFLSGLKAAVKRVESGNKILFAHCGPENLTGYVFDPETMKMETAREPIDVPVDIFRTPVILGTIGRWLREKGAEIAWEATLAMNGKENLPEACPEFS